MGYTHKEGDSVVLVVPKLVLVCYSVQDPHATCQCYEEVTMVGNPTVCNFCSFYLKLDEWNI